MAGHTDGLAIMLAWTANPSPVMCPAWSMQPLPVWAATLPSAPTTATWRRNAAGSAAAALSSASAADAPAASASRQRGP
jgi:hypothetical protein